MNIDFEYKDDGYGEVIYSYYLTSKINDYRIMVTFLGAIDDDDKEDVISCMGAEISVNEITHHRPEIIEEVRTNLKQNLIDAEIVDETIMNTIPEKRQSIEIKNEIDYNSTIDYLLAVIGAVQTSILKREIVEPIAL